jgi:hypothetical protein
MNVYKIFDNVTSKLQTGLYGKQPTEFQLRSTPMDNLVEFAGRICYESLGSTKSRGSKEYHQHINEVGHGSVQEHGWIYRTWTDVNSFDLNDIVFQCRNRPGVFVYHVDSDPSDGKARYHVTVCANLRAIKEWDVINPELIGFNKNLNVGKVLQKFSNNLAPMVNGGDGRFPDEEKETWGGSVSPKDTTYVSFLIEDVSRNLTHELVRHKFQTAVSQRSTRYVNEANSEIAWHPLLRKSWLMQPFMFAHSLMSKLLYRLADFTVSRQLVKAGLTALAARKQSRGAARSFLPSALSSDLVFTASLAQWERICMMRGSEHADIEIRLLADRIFYILKDHYGNGFGLVESTECADGFGFNLKKV